MNIVKNMEKIIDSLKRWEHSWLTPKAVSSDSPSHGLGIRAKEDIKKGEDILVGSSCVSSW